MARSQLERVVVAGGSIAAVTTAEALRLKGFEGSLTVLSDEADPPYSRVPLSKGILAGRENAASASLPALADGIEVRQGARAAAVDTARRRVRLADGEECPYDALVIATGARARRLGAPGRVGEHVVRNLEDARTIAGIAATSSTVIVIGSGFLGMEVASTCATLGLYVTVVDRNPPLNRVLGAWFSAFVTRAASEKGVRFVLAPDGVELFGTPEITGVVANGAVLEADLVISAVGDLPNVEWLDGSGIPVNGGVVTDEYGRVAPGVFAAGDVTVRQTASGLRRTPHWTPAIRQAQTVAASIVQADKAALPSPDSYFWTEQFGLDIKVSGTIPPLGKPEILQGGISERSALLQWPSSDGVVAAASVNFRLPIVKLKRLVTSVRLENQGLPS